MDAVLYIERFYFNLMAMAGNCREAEDESKAKKSKLATASQMSHEPQESGFVQGSDNKVSAETERKKILGSRLGKEQRTKIG